MTWTWAALMPHPPIIIPEVGRGREQEAAATLDGTALLCGRLADLRKNLLDIAFLLLLAAFSMAVVAM